MKINTKESYSLLREPTVTATLLASLLLASVSTYSFAADEDTAEDADFEEVIVTGSRTGKALNKIPGAVSIISNAEIEHDMALTSDVTAMLARTVPGYSQSRQQMTRGGETLRGRVALRLLDGIPQGSPLRDGSRDSIFTDMGIVQRVEVVNGPSATEGIGASGGIINYITKTPTENGTEIYLSALYRTQFKKDSDSWRVALNASHKTDDYDVLVAGTFAQTGISYDGQGRTIGLSASGSDRDSQSDNLFIKVGYNFGADKEQRIQLSHSRFVLECQCNYRTGDIINPNSGQGNRDAGIPIDAVLGQPPGGVASFNDFKQTVLTYTHNDLFGGSLQVQIYDADQAMRFESERGRSKADPLVRPFPVDADGFPTDGFPAEQSEINSQKEGLRSSWSTDALFGNDGVGLQIGADFVKDVAQQKLAIADVTWVPPMEYKSFAPFAQFSYDAGPVTITAGIRHEDGKLDVPDYTTSWDNDRRFVNGGVIDYGEWLPNVGGIWRVNDAWSVYASWSRGFTLPNAGIPLRNIRCSNDTSSNGDPSDPINFPFGGIQPDGCPNDPAISVNDIIDLAAIVVENKELGFSWTGEDGKFGVSIFESNSDFGARLRDIPDDGIDDLVLVREPIRIRGLEVSGNYNVSSDVNISFVYATLEGKSADRNTPDVLDNELNVRTVPANKLNVNIDWQFNEDGNVVLGVAKTFDRSTNVGMSNEENVVGSTLLDLAINYRVLDGTFSIGIDNLLDNDYLLAISQSNPWQSFFTGRGREVTIAYTVKY